jgi:signal transduction histidine kinase
MSPLSSLTNRVFLASTVLATVSIGFAVFFVSNRLRAEAEHDLQRDLAEAASLVEEQRATLLDTFTRTARLIADLPKFKAAVETGDPPTVAPIALDYQGQVGSDLFRVEDPEGRVLADIGGSEAGVLQVVSVAITIGLDRPEQLGRLTVGYLLDDDRAASFKAATGADIAFAVDGRVRSSTFPPQDRATLAELLHATLVPRAIIGGSEYAALVKPLPTLAGERGGLSPVVIVLRSRTERMQTLSGIQTGLAIVAAVTVLLSIVVSYGVSRTVTRPLARITDHMRQIAATGDLTKKLELTERGGWHDEDAHVLATTFNTLTDSVARFQGEAAQRERLSSLGRMSTIIAHEIRNPLMIIKGALRQLTRGGATREDVRDAAADIDGEIERLNRVVNDVLDFARPIQFERSPTDINALCLAAATAVAAAEPDPPVITRLDPDVPSLDTDAEKLRTALVNLLTNARQAVAARNGSGPPPNGPAVTLSTQRLSRHRIAVSIADCGPGIEPDNLSRVFDPYFTTRRAGTGLGLPIAKNIVDGLGGAITVASTPGAGTTIRIELGDAPASHNGSP